MLLVFWWLVSFCIQDLPSTVLVHQSTEYEQRSHDLFHEIVPVRKSLVIIKHANISCQDVLTGWAGNYTQTLTLKPVHMGMWSSKQVAL